MGARGSHDTAVGEDGVGGEEDAVHSGHHGGNSSVVDDRDGDAFLGELRGHDVAAVMRGALSNHDLEASLGLVVG